MPTIQITKHWDGTQLPFKEYCEVNLVLNRECFIVEFEVQLEKYNSPKTAARFTDGLWEYDVFELFILQPNGEYLEVEVGPGGHWLVYEFSSYRERKHFKEIPLVYTCAISKGTWKGKFEIPLAWISYKIEECKMNAYQYRTHNNAFLAWQSIPSIEPDFHRSECFQPLFK